MALTPEEQAYYNWLERRQQQIQADLAQERAQAAQAAEKRRGISNVAIPAAGLGAAYYLGGGLPSMASLESQLQGLGESFGLFTPAQTPVAEGAAVGGEWGLAGNLLGPAMGAFQGYNLINSFGDASRRGSPISSTAKGAMAGAGLGSYFGPVGTVVGGALGGLTGLVGKLSASGKGKDQMKRDQVRKALRESGALDESYNVRLADGSTFNFGADGGAKLTNSDGQTERRYWEIDWKNPTVNRAVSGANPLGHLLGAGNKDSRLTLDMVSYLTNAATTNAKDEKDVDNNLRAIYSQFGVGDRDSAIGNLDALRQQKKISEDQYSAFSSEIDKLFPQAPQQPSNNSRRAIAGPAIEKPQSDRPIRVNFSEMPVSEGASAGQANFERVIKQMSAMRGRA